VVWCGVEPLNKGFGYTALLMHQLFELN